MLSKAVFVGGLLLAGGKGALADCPAAGTTASSFVTVTTTTTVAPVIRATSTASPPSSNVSTSAATETFYGMGTRYGDGCTEEDCWQDGACSFVDYKLPASIDGSTCVSEDIWNNGANCGGCISVTYKGKTITIMVSSSLNDVGA